MVAPPSSIEGYEGLPLPSYVREDLGFVFTRVFPDPGTGPFFSETIKGEFVEVPIAYRCVFTTSAIAGNRGIYIYIQDEATNVGIEIPAIATQAPSTVTRYTWAASVGNAYAMGTFSNAQPLPHMALLPGFVVGISPSVSVLSDTLTQIVKFCIRYPTGPERIATQLPRPLDLAGIGVL